MVATYIAHRSAKLVLMALYIIYEHREVKNILLKFKNLKNKLRNSVQNGGVGRYALHQDFSLLFCEKWNGFFYMHMTWLSYTQEKGLKSPTKH